MAFAAACLVASGAAADDASTAPPGPASAWAISRSTDSFTDERSVSAWVYAKGQAPNAAKDGFSMSCVHGAPGQIRLTFVHLPYLGPGRRILQYRVDDGVAEAGDWSYGESGAVLSGALARQVLGPLTDGKRLRIRATIIDYTPVDAEFDVSGAREALQAIVSECALP